MSDRAACISVGAAMIAVEWAANLPVIRPTLSYLGNMAVIPAEQIRAAIARSTARPAEAATRKVALSGVRVCLAEAGRASAAILLLMAVAFTGLQAASADDEMPTPQTIEQFVFSKQEDLPSLPAKQWAWVPEKYPVVGNTYVFGDRVLVLLQKSYSGDAVLWNPMTGRGRRVTAVQAELLFKASGEHDSDARVLATQLSDGTVLTPSNVYGGTLHCGAVLSTAYTRSDPFKRIISKYTFVGPVSHPKTIRYPVCSEGELPDFITARVDLESAGLTFTPLNDGSVLATVHSLDHACVFRLDSTFHQRAYAPGCPIQLDAAPLDAAFQSWAGDSPLYRLYVARFFYEAAKKQLTEITH